MQAVRKQATEPDMKARKTTPAKSDFRSGAMDDRVASWTPGPETIKKVKTSLIEVFVTGTVLGVCQDMKWNNYGLNNIFHVISFAF